MLQLHVSVADIIVDIREAISMELDAKDSNRWSNLHCSSRLYTNELKEGMEGRLSY